MSNGITESIVEETAIAWLESLGYAVLHGPDITQPPIIDKGLFTWSRKFKHCSIAMWRG